METANAERSYGIKFQVITISYTVATLLFTVEQCSFQFCFSFGHDFYQDLSLYHTN